jgi:hypothetical protein
MDGLKGIGLIAVFVAVFATFAALMERRDSTWRIAVSPIRHDIDSAT